MNTEQKVLINTLIDFSKQKLDKEERKEILEKLLKTMTYREIEKTTGIPKTTIFFTINGRAEILKSEGRHKLINILSTLKHMKEVKTEDKDILIKIKEQIERLSM